MDASSASVNHSPEAGQGYALDLYDDLSEIDGLTLEEELAALSDDASSDGTDPAMTSDNRQKKSTETKLPTTPSSFARLTEGFLDDWTDNLKALASLPSTEANKVNLISHANALSSWVRHNILPRVSALEADRGQVKAAKQELEADYEALLSQAEEVLGRYEVLYEAYSKEYDVSRDKTEKLREVCLLVEQIGEFVQMSSESPGE
ncbi:hypothetical protein Z517_01788 [Fonsecaea pedrosoi CBS 271.37]|uniref:Uncharacterized protein n=1 Tax=Fonsecaea pedrosoi CBS 271.37 TaxID=1442368 RepID=A0A0D2FI98_9EURO|nr:uncharacterized protein Z517_01788 [Fonsecaea pedrosoi CBS 271.37]KIW86392.1 hypothetical protein Z517_01788 [Fonsecaea pedrosoi CBS 271.37]